MVAVLRYRRHSLRLKILFDAIFQHQMTVYMSTLI